MISNDSHRRLSERVLWTVRILWIAFLASTLIMPAIAIFAISPQSGEPGASVVFTLLPLILIGEAVLLFVASLWCRFRFPSTRLRSPSLDVRSLLQGYALGNILAYALAEAIGISGIVLYLLGIPAAHAAPYALVSVLLVLLEAPRSGDLPSLYEQARAARPEVFS